MARTVAAVALALTFLALSACIHEVKREPQKSLLPPGKVAVVGEVRRPGVFDFRPGMTVVDALRAASGFGPMAQPDSSMITRSVSGFIVSTTLHLGAIADGREPALPLEEGDVIQVPARTDEQPRPQPAFPPPEPGPDE